MAFPLVPVIVTIVTVGSSWMIQTNANNANERADKERAVSQCSENRTKIDGEWNQLLSLRLEVMDNPTEENRKRFEESVKALQEVDSRWISECANIVAEHQKKVK